CNGRLVGPVDLFDDPAFDMARHECSYMANRLRRQGIFEPHRLPPEEMEYTTLPKVMERLKDRFMDSGEKMAKDAKILEKEDMD
ncbi:MAG TPA: fructose 1,6-bisphosphatase, partial [Thermodesulfatator sp.]|nr:fructose 1,6-bisphosphatase [Thermodesulfatator sp.]